MIGKNVLITETVKETTTTSGIILTGDTTKGSKPGLVLMVGPTAAPLLRKGQRVFLDWSKGMAVDVDGNGAVIVDMEYIKAIL
jgi:co-chaperonin GroES (HSP10)|tara:strand:+ start:770 stop:1018 length:249 start_codon:yes stop_codon:yes gene_type:complete